MRNAPKQAVRGPRGAGAPLTVGVHVVSRHLGWGEALSEGIGAVDTLLNGQKLLRGGQSRVGVHDALHPSTPTTICLSCGTKKKADHVSCAAQRPTQGARATEHLLTFMAPTARRARPAPASAMAPWRKEGAGRRVLAGSPGLGRGALHLRSPCCPARGSPQGCFRVLTTWCRLPRITWSKTAPTRSTTSPVTEARESRPRFALLRSEGSPHGSEPQGAAGRRAIWGSGTP